jgi:5-methylcytosine-specific restriction endonuclease McrA
VSSSLKPAGSTRRWRRIRLWVLDRDGWRCQLPPFPGETGAAPAPGSWAHAEVRATVCAEHAEHVDHVTPRAAGGTDHPDQLRASCARHNLERGARLEDTPTTTTHSRRPRAGRWEW